MISWLADVGPQRRHAARHIQISHHVDPHFGTSRYHPRFRRFKLCTCQSTPVFLSRRQQFTMEDKGGTPSLSTTPPPLPLPNTV